MALALQYVLLNETRAREKPKNQRTIDCNRQDIQRQRSGDYLRKRRAKHLTFQNKEGGIQ
jgi:hypothetical protein